MNKNISTKPSKDFRTKDTQISELEAKTIVYTHLAQAMEDVKLGIIQDADKAFDDIIKELEHSDQ